jgi:hypothetical protein
MKNTPFYFLMLLALACSSSVDKASSIKNPEYVYQGAGIEQYFLPELPAWANFSVASACHRKNNTRYLDFNTLRKSYSLNYSELVNFQHMFNRQIASFKINNPTATLYLKDEAYIFNNVYQLLIGGGRDFLIPKYNKISLIWIDPYLNDSKKIINIFQDKKVLEGFPILVTDCMTTQEIETFISKNKLDKFGVKYIGQEMFSPYGTNYKIGTMFTLDFGQILANKDITLYGKYRPMHLKGIKKFIKK